jgi:hypothetical protein
MISDETRSVIARSKQIFEQHRERLEAEHRDRYVAIEPESSECFLADTFDDAVRAARAKYPTRLSHTIRIGHEAAFRIGLRE